MSPKKFTIIVCCILLIGTVIFSMSLSAPIAITDALFGAFNNLSDSEQARLQDRVSVQTIKELIKQEQENGNGTSDPYDPTNPSQNQSPGPNQNPNLNPGNGTPAEPPPSSWIADAEKAHRAMGCGGLVYRLGGSGVTYYGTNVRTDCSGYVSYALYMHGLTTNPKVCSSGSNWSAVNGVVLINTSDIQPGDIAVYSGHVQIYMGPGLALNWGGKSSAQNLYVGKVGQDPNTCGVNPVSGTKRGAPLRAYRVTK